MKVSVSWLQRYFKNSLPSAPELADMFTFHAFEVEGVEPMPEAKTSILDLKVLPDRAHYALSHRGVARELALISGFNITEIPVSAVSIGKTKPLSITIDATAKDFCRRYVGRRAEGVTVTDSPLGLRTDLESIGARSINSIVDMTNFIMFDIGQPLHAFDADKVVGGIVVRSARHGETITVLDSANEAGKVVALSTDDFVIADHEGALAIAGVKGGKRAQVTHSTKNIIIESAHFDASIVRRTSTRISIRNDSSTRFENAITPELAGEAMERISALIIQSNPKATCGDVVDVYPVRVQKQIISINRAFITRRLGVEITDKDIHDILRRMRVEVLDGGEDTSGTIELIIPHDRLDITIPEDIVEEIGRIYGYEKIKSILPQKPTRVPEINPIYYVTEQIKDVLVNEGFSEVMLYTFVPKGDIEIAYPLASDKSHLRTNLSTSLMKSIQMNAHNADLLGLNRIAEFEIGNVFTKGGEELHLCIGLRLIKKLKGTNSASILESVLTKLASELGATFNTKEIKVSPEASAYFEGNLTPMIASVPVKKYGDSRIGSDARDTRYIPFSIYPFVVRDIAVFVSEGISAGDVWKNVSKGISLAQADALLVRHALFDTFVKDGRTSYAFRMVFQSHERTLVDTEVNEIMEKIYAEVKSAGWEVR